MLNLFRCFLTAGQEKKKKKKVNVLHLLIWQNGPSQMEQELVSILFSEREISWEVHKLIRFLAMKLQ